MIERLALGVIGVVLLSVVVYMTGRSHGADAVQAEWDADKLVQAEKFGAQTEKAAAISAGRERELKGIVNALEKSVVAITADNDMLGRRLLDAANRPRNCPLPVSPATAAADTGTAGRPADGREKLERRIDEYRAAAGRTRQGLIACIAAYDSLTAP